MIISRQILVVRPVSTVTASSCCLGRHSQHVVSSLVVFREELHPVLGMVLLLHMLLDDLLI